MGLETVRKSLDRVAVLEAELRKLPRAKRAARLAELKATLSAEDFAYLKDVLAAPPLKPAKPAPPASGTETKRKSTAAGKPNVPTAPPAAKPALPPVEREKRFLHWRVQPEGGPEYELTDYLGGGGMASVWRAEQRGKAKGPRWPSIAACKIPEHAASPKAAAEALKAEAKLLEEIDHPKVIKCIRPGFASPPEPVASTSGIQFRPEQVPCYLMELPKDAMSFGKWLKQREARLEAGPVKCEHHVAHVRLVLRIFRDIATTFSTLLSEHSLVHGDQSFGNVLIVPGRNPDNPDFRLIDLGCAQRVRNHMKVGGVAGYSEVEVCCGTLGFASAEQRHRHGRLHRTSDGFALGAMWFSAFAGKSAREMDELLFKPAPAAPAPDGQLTLPSLFQRVPAEELCAQLTKSICSHGLRQRLLQERERLLTILRGTLTDDVTKRLEMSALREEFDALEKALAVNHWDKRVRGRPNTAINHSLFGREEDMAGVVAHFAAAGEGPAIVLLTGLGGVGKTALCEAYIDRFHEDYDYILWSTASDEITFLTSIAEFLVKLGLNRKGVPIEQQRATFLSRISQPGVLWVINNLHDDSKGRNDWLAKWLPTKGTTHILINSRVVKSKIPGLAGGRAVLERRLKPLAEADALAFLCDRARLPMPTGKELRFAKKLVGHEGLDGLPLAIELCGALLDAKAHEEGRPMSFAEYWRLFQRDYTTLDWKWEKAATELGRTGKEQLRRVAVVWRQLFELIDEKHPAAAALLRLSAALPPDDIPVELLRRDVNWPDDALQAVLAIPDDAQRDTALFEQINVLAGHSLIDWNPKSRSWSVHRLVQQVVWASLWCEDQEDWSEAVTDASIQFFANSDFVHQSNLPLGRRLFASFVATRNSWIEHSFVLNLGRCPTVLARAWTSVGDLAQGNGNTALALEAYSHAIRMTKWVSTRFPDEVHIKEALEGLQDRAIMVMITTGDLKMAQLKIREWLPLCRWLARNDPNNAVRQWRLAIALARNGDIRRAQGNLETSKQCYQGCLAITQMLVKSAPENMAWKQTLVVTQQRLAGTLERQNRLKEARKQLVECLTECRLVVRKRSRDPDWQELLAGILIHMGAVLKQQRDLEAAHSALGEGLRISRRLARRDLLNVVWQRQLAEAYGWVGGVLLACGKLRQAQAASGKCLGIISRLVKQDPTNLNYRWDLAEAHDVMCTILSKRGETLAAIPHGKESVRLLAQLNKNPPRKNWKSTLLERRKQLAMLLRMSMSVRYRPS